MSAWTEPSVIVSIATGIVATAALGVAAWQLYVQAQATHVQAWAYLLDTFNRRWAHYIAAQQADQRRFALGELVNFLEVLAKDVEQKRLPRATRELLTPYLCGVIDLMAREKTVRSEVAAMKQSPKTFFELRTFCERRMNSFGDYTLVAELLKPVAAVGT